MITKHFDVNEEGCSIRCTLYCQDPKSIRRIILFGHGFGGHKDNKAAAKLAERGISKYKGLALIAFDWPCHGEDGRKNLLLEDCDHYLTLMLDTCRSRFNAQEIYANATSFGGYLFLKYIADHGNPFRKAVFRCPAIDMLGVMNATILTPDDREKLAHGKPVLAGFDRKVKISRDFLEALKSADIRTHEYLDWAEDILILHGTKDELIPMESSADFADNNLIEFVPITNADHRFTDPKTMDEAIHQTLEFFSIHS